MARYDSANCSGRWRPLRKELTRQLRLFEQRGSVTRQVFPEVPPRVEYQVTALGKSLRPTLDSLAEWMRRHAPQLIGG